MTLPELEPYCGSWIVVDRKTGVAAFETWTRKVAERVNLEKYEVLTAAQWLARVQAQINATEGVL